MNTTCCRNRWSNLQQNQEPVKRQGINQGIKQVGPGRDSTLDFQTVFSQLFREQGQV